MFHSAIFNEILLPTKLIVIHLKMYHDLYIAMENWRFWCLFFFSLRGLIASQAIIFDILRKFDFRSSINRFPYVDDAANYRNTKKPVK